MYTEEQLSRMNLADLEQELANKKKDLEEGKWKKPMPFTVYSGQVEGEIKQLENEIRKNKINNILDS
jgi:hypothetical protein